MDRLRVDISRIVRLNVHQFKERLPSAGPPRRQMGQFERPAITTAIRAAANVSNTAKLLKEVMELADAARRIPVSFIGGSARMFRMPTSLSTITVGAGGSTSAFAVVGVTMGAGIYGSNTPELGLYDNAGGGIWTNAGVSSGLVLTYVFGPPASFGGMSWSVSVSADMPGVGFGVNASLLFGASGPPYDFLGYAVGVAAGVSLLPADISFQVSNTRLLPLT